MKNHKGRISMFLYKKNPPEDLVLMSNKYTTVKEHTIRVCSQILSRIMFYPKASALIHRIPNNLDSKR